jgi:hypothetical protein
MLMPVMRTGKRTNLKTMRQVTTHSLVERGEKLVHRRLGFVAHVGNAERGALDFSVAAVNQEALVLDQLLQFRHVHGATAGRAPLLTQVSVTDSKPFSGNKLKPCFAAQSRVSWLVFLWRA